MATGDIQTIKKELGDINRFVRERFDPVTEEVDLLKEETERLKRDIVDVQQRERATRRDALMRHTDEQTSLVVPEGPYSGLDILDLAILRRFGYSQRRESFGPAWLERAEEAKRLLVSSITPATVQASHQAASRKLETWYTVDHKPTGQFEAFSRSVLQSLTRASHGQHDGRYWRRAGGYTRGA